VGVVCVDDIPISRIRERIDWTPFFHAWEMRGVYPRILEDRRVGEQATILFNDAKAMLDRIEKEHWLEAEGVVGIFPANSVGDDIEVYNPSNRTELLATLHTLRQQSPQRNNGSQRALSDYIAPKSQGIDDHIGMFAVTCGKGIEKKVAEFESAQDDYSAILLKALADRLAEAFAETLHEEVRKNMWGYAPEESLSVQELIKERYIGIRPAPGYPACPDHTEKTTLFQLLDVEAKTTISLTSQMAMKPAATVSGWFFAHPESGYFSVSAIGMDQVRDYGRRKGISEEESKKLLGMSVIENNR
jgi:5-methyltetrahydrofolate--homocysteine methyltransferase